MIPTLSDKYQLIFEPGNRLAVTRSGSQSEASRRAAAGSWSSLSPLKPVSLKFLQSFANLTHILDTGTTSSGSDSESTSATDNAEEEEDEVWTERLDENSVTPYPSLPVKSRKFYISGPIRLSTLTVTVEAFLYNLPPLQPFGASAPFQTAAHFSLGNKTCL